MWVKCLPRNGTQLFQTNEMEPSWRSKPLVIYLARFFWIHSKTLHVALSFVLKVVWKLLRATHHVEILAYSWRCIKRWIVRIVCRRPVNRDKLVSFCLCFFFLFPLSNGVRNRSDCFMRFFVILCESSGWQEGKMAAGVCLSRVNLWQLKHKRACLTETLEFK